MKIKNLYKDYAAASRACNKAYSEWEREPNNSTVESAYDKAYEAEHKSFVALCNEIMRLTGCTGSTARIMVIQKRQEIESMISRLEG